jgi:hypothetical protein
VTPGEPSGSDDHVNGHGDDTHGNAGQSGLSHGNGHGDH